MKTRTKDEGKAGAGAGPGTGCGERKWGVTKRSEQRRQERVATGAMQQPRGIGKLIAMEWGTIGQL